MITEEKISIDGIPAILWGKPSQKIYIHVHGKMSRKEYARRFAEIAEAKGWQTLSFDLPEHGERTDTAYRCDIRNGMHDLNVIADYVFAGRKKVSLFACSLGAYFSLNTYADRQFEKCLFQSPIVDMKWLVQHMMLWSDVSEKQLEEKQEIITEIDTLRWDYYQYILSHPISRWTFPTAILYGAKDNLQPLEAMYAFTEKFGAKLTVSEQSEHPFMASEDHEIVDKWLYENI
ncbi:MAG: alpha/beta hydrolase [Oscillospiraceae bacterium]|nr:alpha/beta hydrolase [Oscillospiraceae bacterium]